MFDKDKGWQGSNVRHETLTRWDQRISKSIVQLSLASPCGVGHGYATAAHLTPFGILCLIEIVMHNNGGANSYSNSRQCWRDKILGKTQLPFRPHYSIACKAQHTHLDSKESHYH